MADVVVEKERTSSSSPIIAVVAIVVLAFLAYLAWQYFGAGTAETTDINVTTPAPTVQNPVDGQ